MKKTNFLTAATLSLLEIAVASGAHMQCKAVAEARQASNPAAMPAENNTRASLKTIIDYLKSGEKDISGNYSHTFLGYGEKEEHKGFEYTFIFQEEREKSLKIKIAKKSENGTKRLIVLIDRITDINNLDCVLEEAYEGLENDNGIFLLPVDPLSKQLIYESLVKSVAGAIKLTLQQ